MNDQFGGATFSRAHEAPEEVVIGRGAAETEGLQPEDLGVLVYLLLLAPGALASAKDLAAGMRELGWKMSVDRFEVIAKRLAKAGHLSRESMYDSTTKRPQWQYWAYRNPANNPGYVQDGAAALSQVTGEIGDFPVSEASTTRETGDSPVSTGQGRNRVFPDFGKSRTPDSAVPAGHGRNRGIPGSAGHPPHPPEEEDSSSPNPLTRATSGAQAAKEGEAEFAPEELRRAEAFLQQMKTWQAGGSTARKCAPRLLRTMRRQSWPALCDMDEDQQALLESEIFKNTGGAHSWVKCLSGWVEDLRIYDRARSRPAAVRGAGGSRERCPDHPARYRNGCIDCALTVPA
ncbi:hypothetical protein [Streptomyces sp. NPDC059916]|uniref:hypothetical protein n=1 Tax=Streptomyces sp. NPDC059916 TaxID=3347001 RepID=UPI003699BC03